MKPSKLPVDKLSYMSAPIYTRRNFDPPEFQELVDRTVDKVFQLRVKHPEIEALAAMGHSGQLLMGAVAYLTGLPQIAVRKEVGGSHDTRIVNGWVGCKGYLIIDDFISSGTTVDKIISSIEQEYLATYNRQHADWQQYYQSMYPSKHPEPVRQVPKPVAFVFYECNANDRYEVVHDGKLHTMISYSVFAATLDPPQGTWCHRTTASRRLAYNQELAAEEVKAEVMAAEVKAKVEAMVEIAEAKEAVEQPLGLTPWPTVIANGMITEDPSQVGQVLYLGSIRKDLRIPRAQESPSYFGFWW